MQLHIAERKKAKIKMAIQGPSGSGKTFSALLLAFGLCGDWSKIAIIDTENHSADLYAHLGGYNVLSLVQPYRPEKYMEAIAFCEKAGMDVIILDSISHEWEGPGGILDTHSGMAGNSFSNWAKLTPRHNAFIQSILQSQSHIIGTIRSKQDYVLQEKNGKIIPEKVGLKGVTREGMDYEFTIVLDLDIKHHTTSSKDRTGLFEGKPAFKISVETGKLISSWCNDGVSSSPEPARLQSCNDATISPEELNTKIENCQTYNDLIDLYKQYPTDNEELLKAFTDRRKALQNNKVYHINKPQNLSNNGVASDNQPG